MFSARQYIATFSKRFFAISKKIQICVVLLVIYAPHSWKNFTVLNQLFSNAAAPTCLTLGSVQQERLSSYSMLLHSSDYETSLQGRHGIPRPGIYLRAKSAETVAHHTMYRQRTFLGDDPRLGVPHSPGFTGTTVKRNRCCQGTRLST